MLGERVHMQEVHRVCVCDGVRGLEASVCAREKRLVWLVGGKVCVCVCEQ